MAKKQSNDTDRFREQLEQDNPPAWKPNARDMIVGTIIRYTTGRSTHPKLPDTYPIAIVHDEATDELVSVHIVLTAIRSQFERENPKVGERVGIAYRGLKTSKESGSEYHDYRVVVDREDAAESAKSFADIGGVEQDELPY